MSDAARWEVDVRPNGVVVAAYRNEPMSYLVGEAVVELRSYLRAWRSADVRVVVLTGAEDGRFITHYSVEEMAPLADDPSRVRALGPSVVKGFQETIQELADLDKPVIAALRGDTMGGGLELALGCDLRFAQQGDYRIGFPEVGFGLIAAGGGISRLARLIGTAAALDILLRGRVLPPEEALRLGIVTELRADVLQFSIAVADALAALPAPALSETKRAVLRGSDQQLALALRVEAEGWVEAVASGDAGKPIEEFLALPFERRRDWIEARAAVSPRPTSAS